MATCRLSDRGAIGFRRRDLRAITAWQATLAGLIAVGAGAVLGVVIGRLAWSATAASAGVVEVIVVPAGAVLAVAAGTLVAWVASARVVARVRLRGPAAAALRVD